jgi:Flp pilus assembly protein TadG
MSGSRLMRVLMGWAGRGERGSAAVEAVILAPPMLTFIALAVVGMRIEIATGSLEAAAHDAARAASISRTADAAQVNATIAAADTLSRQGLMCTPTVDLTDVQAQFARPTGQPAAVTVRITCDLSFADILAPGVPGSKVVSSEFTSPIDQYRGRQG